MHNLYFLWFFHGFFFHCVYMVFSFGKPDLCGYRESHSACARLNPPAPLYPMQSWCPDSYSWCSHQPSGSLQRRVSHPWPGHHALPLPPAPSHPRLGRGILCLSLGVKKPLCYPCRETWLWVKKLKIYICVGACVYLWQNMTGK